MKPPIICHLCKNTGKIRRPIRQYDPPITPQPNRNDPEPPVLIIEAVCPHLLQ